MFKFSDLHIGKQELYSSTVFLFSSSHAWRSSCLSTANLLNTVTLKLPTFWPDNIQTWFVQSESQFKGMTGIQTKFDYCVQSMMQEVAIKALDLIRNPPTKYSYQLLKDRLLQMFALNNFACAQ